MYQPNNNQYQSVPYGKMITEDESMSGAHASDNNPSNVNQPLSIPEQSGAHHISNQPLPQHNQPGTAPLLQLSHVKLARKLGITQVVIGLLCFFFQIIYIMVDEYWQLVTSASFLGIWGGIFITIAGALCICASHSPTQRCQKCGALTLNIFCVIISITGLSFTYIDILNLRDCTSVEYYHSPLLCSNYTLKQIIVIFLSILMGMEFFISICSAIATGCGCGDCGCCCNEAPGQIAYIVPAHPIYHSHPTSHLPYTQQQTGYQPNIYQNIQPPVSPTAGNYEPGNTTQVITNQTLNANTDIPPQSIIVNNRLPPMPSFSNPYTNSNPTPLQAK